MITAAIRAFFSRLGDLFLRRRREARLSEEIAAHLDALAEDYVARGMDPDEARLAARRAFGGVDRIGALHREQRGFPALDAIFRDVRFGARLLLKERSFTAAAILTLGLGLGVNTAMFTIINGMTWRGLPVEAPDEVMQIVTVRTRGRRSESYTSYADFRDWRAATQTFRDLAAYAPAPTTLGDEQRPADWLAGVAVTANAFRLLGVSPAVGRDFALDDDRPGAARVVLLGHHVWTARYAAAPDIVGRVLRINGEPATVIGVMPEGFRFPARADLWMPFAQSPAMREGRDARTVDVFGRLRDGATLDQARAELATLTAALAERYPDTNAGIGASVRAFTYGYVSGPSEDPIPLLLLAAAAVVLLVACANTANLLFARATQRGREMALRAAIGASRGQILRQLFVEAVMLSFVAATVGVLIAAAAVAAFSRETVDLGLPYWIAFELDTRVLIYAVLIAIGAAVAFGLAPAWQLSRTGAADALKDGGRGTIGGAGRARWTSALLVSEVAMTVTLLAGASFLVQGGLALYRADAALDLEQLVVARVALPAGKYSEPEQRRRFLLQLQDRLDADPAIASATIASARPFVDANAHRLLFEGETATPDALRTVQTVGIRARYFETLGVTLVSGRTPTREDTASNEPGVVVNTRFAEAYVPNASPLGRRIQLLETTPATATGQWYTIVGVSPAIRQQPMGPARPVVYVPLDTQPAVGLSVIARGRTTTDALGALLREHARAVDADVAIHAVQTLERLSELSRWTPRMVSVVLTLAAIIAMALAALGLYGITSYGVAQRTSEIGVRVALGARRADVARLVLRRTATLVAAGLALGLAGALAAGRLLGAVTGQSSANGPATVAGVAVLLIAVALAASVVPLGRALRLDPAAALRHE